MVADKKRRTHNRQLKIDAVNLAVNGERSVSEVACDLGIALNISHRWKQKLTTKGSESFPAPDLYGMKIWYARSIESMTKTEESTAVRRSVRFCGKKVSGSTISV